MCTKCEADRSWLEEPKVDAHDPEEEEEDRLVCGWFEERDGDGGGDGAGWPGGLAEEGDEEAGGLDFCGEPAVALQFFEVAEDHLCDRCVAGEKEQREQGLEEFLRAVGLEEACEYLAIDPGEVCATCSAPATRVKVATLSTPLCEDHAAPHRGGSPR